MTPVRAAWLFEALYVLLLVRIVLSWIPGIAMYHPVVQFVHRVTSPILDPIRHLVPPVAGIDFSPRVGFLLLSLAQRIVTVFMFRVAYY